jgi:hypothetical protein
MSNRHWGVDYFFPRFKFLTSLRRTVMSDFERVRQDIKLSGDEHLIRLESQLSDDSFAMLTGIFADLHNSSDEATEG